MKRFWNRIFSFTPTLLESWILFAVVVLVGGLFGVFISYLPLSQAWSQLISYFVMMLTPFMYAYIRASKKGHSLEGGVNIPLNVQYKWRVNPIIFSILILPTFYSFTLVVEPLNTLIDTPEWFERLMRNSVIGENLVLSFATTSILAPIMEELLCRGLILRGLIANGKSPLAAIVWSALIFGVIHLNPWQAIPAFLTGLLFGWLYYKTKCIWVPIWLHFVNNATTTFLYVYLPEEISSRLASMTTKELIGNDTIYFAVYAISIAILAISYLLITRYIGYKDEQSEKTTISA